MPHREIKLTMNGSDLHLNSPRVSLNKTPVSNCQSNNPEYNRHWKEAVYDTELMTGYLEKGGIPEPLSAMTIGSIADLGYTVDMSKAQDYTVHYDFSSSSGRRLRDDPESEAASKRRLEEQVAKGEKIPIGNDIADVPIIDISEVKEIEVNIKPGREADHEKAKAAFAERRKKMQGLIPELP
jgi:hypothetical protein